jgi:hypothetical protein
MLKAFFSTQLTDGLRWTLDSCFIDDRLRLFLIMFFPAPRGDVGGVST